jgi:Mn2+/Fe2+ NRAMP family transporter
VNVLIDILVLSAELGGASVALQLVTGISYRLWALPVGLFVWFIIWRGTFSIIEQGVTVLGLVTLCFVYGAYKLNLPVHQAISGFVPHAPHHDNARYWFLCVSILGSIIAPYLFHFYSSGAIEDKWDETYLMPNRIIAGIGMGFGSIVSMSVLVVAAMVLFPRGIHVDSYDQAALMLTTSLGRAGFFLFAASLFIACIGAALELSLSMGYILAQGLGWNWGEDKEPRDASRFAFVYTLGVFLAVLPIMAGLDPLQITILSMAFTALILPLVIFPFLLLMNDKEYLQDHTNGWISNFVVFVTIALASLLALVSIPLELMGGG